MNKHTVNGVELAFVDRGSGPPVLLVHGFPLDHSMWNAQIEGLSEKHRVIAVDLRGFGQSGVTDGKVTMGQFADDLAGLLSAMEISEPITFVGLSMGGYVAFEFRRRHARRLRALILCDTRAAADTPEAAADRLKTADRVLGEGPGLLVEGMIPRLFAEATAREQPELIESLRRVMLSTDPRGIAAAGRGMAERMDATPLLRGIDCPTLLIVGRWDVISPAEEMRAIARAIPGARFFEIRDSGHMSPMESPAEVNDAMLEFLAELPPAIRGAGTSTGS